MRTLKYSRALFALFLTTTSAMSINPPQYVRDYLSTGGFMEDGFLGGSQAEAEAFILYVRDNWSAVLTDIATIAPDAKKQRLIVAAIEFVQGRDYLSALNKLCDGKAAGSVTDEVLDFAVCGAKVKKGFLSYNFQDTPTRQLVQRMQTLLPAGSPTQQTLTAILSGEQKTKDKDYFEYNDVAEPTPLPPP